MALTVPAPVCVRILFCTGCALSPLCILTLIFLSGPGLPARCTKKGLQTAETPRAGIQATLNAIVTLSIAISPASGAARLTNTPECEGSS